jgi:environmental stress-induced protein Ves
MTLQRVHWADATPQPWRNGGGLTRELLRWPAPLPGADAAAGAQDWLVRVSIAEIQRDGPFSAFPGIERWLAVLGGGGVRLQLPEGEQVLQAGGEPLHFAGAAAPGCALLGGPTQDLNLMHHPLPGPEPGAAVRAQMRRAPPGSMQRGRLPWRALYAHGATGLVAGGEAHELPPGTLVWSDAAEAERWEVSHTEGAYWMSLQP